MIILKFCSSNIFEKLILFIILQLSVIFPSYIYAAPIPPEITGSFGSSTLIAGENGILNFKINNNNSDPLTDVKFTINLEGQLKLDADGSNSCDPSPDIDKSSEEYTLTISNFPGNVSCNIEIHFSTNFPEIITGSNGYILSAVTSNEAPPTPAPNIGTLTITEPADPIISGAYDQSTYLLGETGSFSATFTNTNPVSLSDLYFRINFPIQMNVNSISDVSTTCGVTPIGTFAVDVIELEDFTLSANTACTITISFLANSVGTYTLSQGNSGARFEKDPTQGNHSSGDEISYDIPSPAPSITIYGPPGPTEIVKRADIAMPIIQAINVNGYTPNSASGTVFNDVAATSFNADWIEDLFNNVITEGCTQTDFCPNMVVTKEQLAKLLLKAKFGSTYLPPVAIGLFDDVPVTHPAADWIEALFNQGFSAGCDANNYCPNEAVTRETFLNMMSNVFP